VYKVEPYVVAADVYALRPHTGRGGWSWYTGSAGWMYRLIVESLLGLAREGDRLRFAPCLPADWPSFTIRYRYVETMYDIVVRQALGGAADSIDATSVTLDGVTQPDGSVQLVDDRAVHQVFVDVHPAGKRGQTPLPVESLV
jgi:cyclic beta-1,2-glucan glucanotransferase